MDCIDPKQFEKCFTEWIKEITQFKEGDVVAIDGKTMRGTADRSNAKRAVHIVSAWCSSDKLVLGQVKTDEKSNEITAIPQLLEALNIKGSIITIDAMGTQTAIAKKIKEKRNQYVLAVKENQRSLYEDISLYFEDKGHIEKIVEKGNYKKTIDKNHGMADIREYYQTTSISWLNGKENWKGIKSIGMVVRTYNGVTERRYYISSLLCDIETFATAVRGHWSVEAMY